MDVYDLVLGLPHTNHTGFAEHLLLMYVGHFQWTSIARAIGRPLSALRTTAGGEVYATFYFIEECFPETARLVNFGLDDRLRFGVSLRAFKNLAVEGEIIFDHQARVAPMLADGLHRPTAEAITRHPYVRLANIFITPDGRNSQLRVAPPANADFSGLPILPNEENPYHITKEAEHTMMLGVLDGDWRPASGQSIFEHHYTIDPDRDTNGAGLVYFANYLVFMESAERAAWTGNGIRDSGDMRGLRRSVERRRVAYYGNVDVGDTIRTEVSLFTRHGDPRRIGIRYAIRRDLDARLICLSEAVKVLAEPVAR